MVVLLVGMWSAFKTVFRFVDTLNNIVDTGEELEVNKQKFIDDISPIAQKVSGETGVLPSIIIGQAILESNWGTSELAANYNNLFGVKGVEGSSQSVLLPTKEFENNEWKEIMAYFRIYGSIEESVRDHSKLFVKGVSWAPNLYQSVLEAKNYQEAANALQTAGYATDPTYAQKIIDVIETYELMNYDKT